MDKPTVVATDLEGVLVPEIWIAFSEETGIEKLKLTTRDVPDYDKLMKGRLEILKDNNLKLKDIQNVIKRIDPLPGARRFLDWLRSKVQVIILSDTFYEFAMPLMEKLGYPTLFCNQLKVDETDTIVDYHLRQKDGKKKAVVALKSLNFRVISMGDSYNDTTMLKEADLGILFRPPENVVKEFPQFVVFEDYDKLKDYLKEKI
ncbi:MAG: bifunctional phosphoserine phosphatase/homoserine phosphotransferase ThrH [Spirochaetes bacterium]|nr:MAG: bifunctional phosphoserine phosphatase/homoserine phosphotransferase ThrH [Spirochaetota bacterium]